MNYFDCTVFAQYGFQNPATPIAEGIIDLHHNIFFFLILILTQVLWLFLVIFHRASRRWKNPTVGHIFRKNYLVLNNLVHGTVLEIVWTIIPSLILMFIAIPSFALLYSIDEVIDPEVTIKVIGHQWAPKDNSDILELHTPPINMKNPIIKVIDDYNLRYVIVACLFVGIGVLVYYHTGLRVEVVELTEQMAELTEQTNAMEEEMVVLSNHLFRISEQVLPLLEYIQELPPV